MKKKNASHPIAFIPGQKSKNFLRNELVHKRTLNNLLLSTLHFTEFVLPEYLRCFSTHSLPITLNNSGSKYLPIQVDRTQNCSSLVQKSLKSSKKKSFGLPAYSTNYKTFKYNSPLYNGLSLLLLNNPINQETQIKLEKCYMIIPISLLI